MPAALFFSVAVMYGSEKIFATLQAKGQDENHEYNEDLEAESKRDIEEA